jgi:hypothetical protein
MRPLGEAHNATSRNGEIKRADKFDRREMEPHKTPPRGDWKIDLSRGCGLTMLTLGCECAECREERAS